VAYLLFFGNIVLLAFGIYKAFKIRHSRVNYVIFSFAPHILWALNLILAAFELVDVLFSKNWLSMIILYEMFLFGWILIKEYVDSFKHVQLLQEKVIAEEKRTIFEIEQTRIQERKMIANILHDKVGVNLARSVHLLELKRYDDVLSLIKNTGVYIRNLSHRILPKSLEMGALSASLKEQIEHLNGEYKDVLIQFDSYDFPENISQERAISLYLIALELIQNALKHASADQIVLELFYYPNAIVMSCTDDGVGSSEPFNYGFGLSTINRRIVDQGGRLDISTDRQTGTCVLVEFPL
jgi:signal transduction histidine kinase